MDTPDRMACDDRLDARPAAAPAGEQCARDPAEEGYLPLDLLAAWLRLRLNVPVMIEEDPNATAVTGVYLTRGDGVLSLERPSTDDGFAMISCARPVAADHQRARAHA